LRTRILAFAERYDILVVDNSFRSYYIVCPRQRKYLIAVVYGSLKHGQAITHDTPMQTHRLCNNSKTRSTFFRPISSKLEDFDTSSKWDRMYFFAFCRNAAAL
jgi:hypothetical protein